MLLWGFEEVEAPFPALESRRRAHAGASAYADLVALGLHLARVRLSLANLVHRGHLREVKDAHRVATGREGLLWEGTGESHEVSPPRTEKGLEVGNVAVLRVGVVFLVVVVVVVGIAASFFEPEPAGEPLGVAREVRALSLGAPARGDVLRGLRLEESQAGDAMGDLDADAGHIAVRLRRRVFQGRMVEVEATCIGVHGRSHPRRPTDGARPRLCDLGFVRGRLPKPRSNKSWTTRRFDEHMVYKLRDTTDEERRRSNSLLVIIP